MAHYMEGQCDVCVPQYGNLDKLVFLFCLFVFVFCFVLIFFFFFFFFFLLFAVFSGLHKVSENIQRAAKRRSITLPAVP